jgi:hypothetical protein
LRRLSGVLLGITIWVQLSIPLAGLSQPQVGTTSKPVKLYGRIEQLTTQNGAQLPANLTRQPAQQSAKLDQPSSTQLPGRASITAVKPQTYFPDAFLGYWQGTLKVHANQFSSLAYEVDREETTKEVELLAPGRVGSVTFSFVRNGGQLSLEPTRIVFSAPMSQSRHAEELKELANSNPMLGQDVAGFLQSVPYYYGLEMGNVAQGTGITGNALHNQVIKNDIRQLGNGIVEQDLVSYNQERNPRDGRMQSGYSEMVLRFYQQAGQQLYVQVASVNYLADGRFKDKILLYGTVQRASSTQSRQYSVPPTSIPPALQDFIKQMTDGNSRTQNPY